MSFVSLCSQEGKALIIMSFIEININILGNDNDVIDDETCKGFIY